MTADKIVEMLGLVLIAAVIVRAIVAVAVFAVRSLLAERKIRKDGAAFRARAGEALDDVKRRPCSKPEGTSRTLRVVERVAENLKGDICSFTLAPADGRPLWAFRPGQFLTLSLPVGGQESAVTRCYSLSETPIAPQAYYRVTVKRLEPAQDGTPSASCFLHDRLEKGDIVEVRPPAGSFCLDQMSERPVVLAGAGVGITPLLSMLNWLVATGSRREIWVFYGARDRTEIAFANHLRAMAAATPNLHTVIFFSRPSGLCRRGLDYDVEGHVSVDVMKAQLKGRAHEFYICGPSPMMDAVTADLAAWGVPAADIKRESFGAGNSVPLPAAAMPDQIGLGQSDDAFRIRFARSNRTVPWNRSFGTLLELAEVLGLPARHSCRAGQCGTCKIPVKCGSVAYLRAPEAQIEAGNCLPCIARPAGDLVLDL